MAFALLLCSVLAAAAPEGNDPRQKVLNALVEELSRSQKDLRLRGHEAPYFLSYAVRGIEAREVDAKYGAVFLDHVRKERRLQVDVRVGSYDFDNTGSQEMFDFDGQDSGYSAGREAPLDGDPAALRNSLWLLTDDLYKKALSAYLKKKGKEVYRPDDPDRPPSFSREEPRVDVMPKVDSPFDAERWKKELKTQSDRLRAHPELFDSQLRAGVERQERELANTEGARLITERALYGLHVQAWARAPDGMLLEDSLDFYGASEAELPRGEKLAAKIDDMVAELLALREAPVLDPYTGPALLSPEAAGVLFHEAVGHRLEGERQNDDKDGRTFKGQIGKSILPGFLSILDDPTRAQFGGTSLNGVYKYDDQGVPAQKTVLVERGVLKTFLLSRAPVAGFSHSNGHGRSSPGRDPVARMGNLIVQSDRTMTLPKLKEALLAEARRQEKPFGLLIRDVTGGNTDTSSYAYQAFKGQPRLVYKVDAKTGEETLVRGVEIVGTPLTALGKITATGDDPRVFNGYCGAESGFVPVSTVAPTVLINEIELQRTRKDAGRSPVLSSPWATTPVTAVKQR
ncbi:MAG TPA: metallopeptidase TldD-related protein [Myxococcales bacterium]|nr:metallopeptidase TldD-related protein [Myxococcales bacterium]